MKEIIVAVVALFLSSVSYAWEVPNNPDRYVSFAIGYEGGTLSGDSYLDVLFGTNVSGLFAGGAGNLDEEVQITLFRPSLRVPLSHSLTLDVSALVTKQEFTHTAQGFDWRGQVDGTMWGGTLRWYLK